jgi:hypothetical protein
MKGLLKKIFGGAENPVAAEKKARSARVRIPFLDPAVFISANGQSYQLLNLSETGLALTNKGEHFPNEVSGMIHVGGEAVAVELNVVRRAGSEIGVTFAGDPVELRGLLRRVFGDEIKAQGMSEVDPSKQKEVHRGTPRWFYAPGNYELFYVEDNGEILRFELEWNGNLLVYANSLVRFGLVDRKPGEEHDKVKHAQSSLVKWADQVKKEDRQKALRILENIKDLEVAARKQIQGFLKD